MKKVKKPKKQKIGVNRSSCFFLLQLSFSEDVIDFILDSATYYFRTIKRNLQWQYRL